MKLPIKVVALSMLLLPLSIPAEVERPIPPTAAIREIMKSLVTPHSDALWGAGSKAYEEPGSEAAAVDDATWGTLEGSRLTLSEVAEALLVTTRPVDTSGVAPLNPEEELTPEQVAAKIAAQPEQWMSAVKILADAVAQMEKPIADHDVQGLATTGDVLYEACAGCHQNFWYPEK